MRGLHWVQTKLSLLRQSDQIAAIGIVGNICRLGLAFLTSVITARLIRPESFGQLMLLLGWGNLLYPLMSLGFDQSLVHFHSESRRINQTELLDAVFKFAIKISLVMFGFLLLAVGIIFFLFQDSPAIIEWRYPISLLIVHLGLWALGSIAVGIQRAHKNFNPGILRESVVFPIFLLVSFLFLVSLFNSGINSYCLSLVIATTLSTGYLFWNLHHTGLIKSVLSGHTSAVYSAKQKFSWVRHSFPTGCMSSLELLIFWMPILVLGWHSSATEVAKLTICLRLGQLCHLCTVAIAPLAAPYLSDAWLLGRKAFNMAIGRFALQTGGSACIIAFVVILLHHPLLALFGQAYTASANLLIIIVFGFIIEASVNPVRQALVSLGNNRANMVISATSVAAIYLAALLLVESYGAVGAAISMVIGTLVGAMGRLYWLAGIEPRKIS